MNSECFLCNKPYNFYILDGKPDFKHYRCKNTECEICLIKTKNDIFFNLIISFGGSKYSIFYDGEIYEAKNITNLNIKVNNEIEGYDLLKKYLDNCIFI